MPNEAAVAVGEMIQSEGALADYTRAILLDPENAFAYVNRGLTLLQQGKIIQAEADFKRALALAPALKPDIDRFFQGRPPLTKTKNAPAAIGGVK